MEPYYETPNGKLYHGNCLDVMPELEGPVDMILCDLPYGTTACKWDVVIPFEPLWAQYKRLIKKNGAIVLTASQPFTTSLIWSNREEFKYCWYWRKSKSNGWQHAKNRPMTAIEEICVFSSSPMGHISLLGEQRMNYNPQGISPSGKKTISIVKHGRTMGARPNQVGVEYESFTGFPCNVLEYSNITGASAIHPTQKPVALFEYLIKTYTNKGDTVLDNCLGSGTTGVACENLGRRWIGIEIEPTLNSELNYCEIAARKIERATKQLKLFV